VREGGGPGDIMCTPEEKVRKGKIKGKIFGRKRA
jgi:hypothetical protein